MGKLNDVAIMCPFMKNFRHELNSEISLRMQNPEKLSHLSYKAKQELIGRASSLMKINGYRYALQNDHRQFTALFSHRTLPAYLTRAGTNVK